MRRDGKQAEAKRTRRDCHRCHRPTPYQSKRRLGCPIGEPMQPTISMEEVSERSGASVLQPVSYRSRAR